MTITITVWNLIGFGIGWILGGILWDTILEPLAFRFIDWIYNKRDERWDRKNFK